MNIIDKNKLLIDTSNMYNKFIDKNEHITINMFLYLSILKRTNNIIFKFFEEEKIESYLTILNKFNIFGQDNIYGLNINCYTNNNIFLCNLISYIKSLKLFFNLKILNSLHNIFGYNEFNILKYNNIKNLKLFNYKIYFFMLLKNILNSYLYLSNNDFLKLESDIKNILNKLVKH